MSDQHNINEHLRHNATSDDPETIRQHRGVKEASRRSGNQTQAMQYGTGQQQSGNEETAESNNNNRQQS